MHSAVLGLLAGVLLLQQQAQLPEATFAVLLIAAGLATGWLSVTLQRRMPRMQLAALLLAGFFLGFGWAALHAHHKLAHGLPAALEGQDLTITGVIDSLPLRFERGVRFNFRVERNEQDHALPPRIALSWYAGDENLAQLHRLLPGERWELRVRLRRPHGNANPHGFDYEAWLLEQGLRATGYVRPVVEGGQGNRRLSEFVPGLWAGVDRMRAALRDRMLSSLADRPYAGILLALVIGDQREISASDWKMFTATGVGHLISISGLHITMIAGLFAAVVRYFWSRSFYTGAEFPLWLPAQKAAALAGALAALAYVLLSGAGVPAQRTLLMLTTVALATLFNRAAMVSHVLCLSLAVVILLDPMAVLGPGFWLSFGAVAVILYAGSGKAGGLRAGQGWREALRNAARTQYAVSIGLVPLSLLLFSQFSLISPFANAMAIPVISFLVTPAALLGSVMPQPLCDWLLLLAHEILRVLAICLSWMASLPLATFHAPVPEPWMFVLALAGLAWLLAPRGWPARAAGLLLWLPLLLNRPQFPEQGAVLTAFDVGQGSAILIETAHRRLLYDTGPWYSPESDGGSRVILPYLRARGIDRLDRMVVSHNDSDHAGGALTLLGNVAIDSTLSSLDAASPVVRAARRHQPCRAGQRWDWDGVRFEMLYPDDAEYAGRGKPNGRSCTLKVSSGGWSVLLPGDIEAKQEKRLLTDMPAKLRAHVLLAPHHGSGTSSTPRFLEAVRPQFAIFQVGYRNRYRHPKAEVWERYGDMQVERLRTDQAGAVRIEIGERLLLSSWRVQRPRYWHAQRKETDSGSAYNRMP